MLAAHGTWLARPNGGEFFIWGDRLQVGVDAAEVATAIYAGLSEDGAPRHAEKNHLTVVFLLPTAAGRALPSPELLPDSTPGRDVRLSRWPIHGMALPPGAALEWLVGLPAETPHPSLRLGADLKFWSTVARFALDLLARQRFLPALAVRSGEPSGRARGPSDSENTEWHAVLEDEQERVQQLAEAMPPVCRAAVGVGSEAPSAEQLIQHFVTAVTDRFVRDAATRLKMRLRLPETVGGHLAASLLRPTGEWTAAPEELSEVRAALARWTAPLEEEGAAPFRLCFRLEPPDDGDAPWTLRYFLQALDDPSLLVPIAIVWEHSGRAWQYLNRRMSRPQERMLEALGRASSLFPPLEESLREARPESSHLQIDQASAFLREGAWLLEESGFGVLVPSWWGAPSHQLGLKLRLSPSTDPGRLAGGPRIGLDALVEFNWEIALGGENLDRNEFMRLVSLKQPLVRVRGRWVELKPDQIERALEALKAAPATEELTLGEALRLGLGKQDDATKLPVLGVVGDGFLGDLLERLEGSAPLAAVETPLSFHGVLRPYQAAGLSWLSFLSRFNLGACLADDMGLGKTIQVLALLLHRQAAGAARGPFLLVCPTSVVSNWRKESERFAPSLRVLVHHGVGRRAGKAFLEEASQSDLVVSTYSLAHRDFERLLSVPWDGVVLDEAQNIKNPGAKQTQAVRRLRAPIRIALTGTPVENRLSELWSILEFLNPGYLGPLARFKRSFALPIERYHDPDAAGTLKRMIQPFLLRRVKTDPAVIKDLPEKNEMKVFCNLTREQATLYAAVVQEGLKRIEESSGLSRKGAVLAALTRLKQVCNHPSHFLADGSRLGGRSGKLTRLEEMLEEVLAEGDRALVFTQFAEMGKLLRRHLREALSVEVIFLHGGVPASEREKMIARFQDDPAGPPIFVLSLKAGGVGLNLTRASQVFHFDRWWNPAVENQATDRAFRIGQTRRVLVHKFVCVGTVEERIDELIARKTELAQEVVGGGEAWLTELSTDTLRDILKLRDEAIEDES